MEHLPNQQPDDEDVSSSQSHHNAIFYGYNLQNADALFEISPSQYATDRDAVVRGTANPSLMDKPFWKSMVFRGTSAYGARCDFGEDSYEGVTSGRSSTAVWCFNRFGATETRVPDGRVVCVGGEHEDFYDPDFCIYNDVVVIESPSLRDPVVNTDLDHLPRSSGSEPSTTRGENLPLLTPDCIKIYGYPTSVFPPTDFHTATYIPPTPTQDHFILIIGGLGYGEAATQNQTNIYRLDLTDYSMQQLEPSGACPKERLYEHSAELIGNGDEAMIRVTTKEGERLGLRVRDLRWFD